MIDEYKSSHMVDKYRQLHLDNNVFFLYLAIIIFLDLFY